MRNLKPNAGPQAPPEAEATQERRLEAVACRPMLDGLMRPRYGTAFIPSFCPWPHDGSPACLTTLRPPTAAETMPASFNNDTDTPEF